MWYTCPRAVLAHLVCEIDLPTTYSGKIDHLLPKDGSSLMKCPYCKLNNTRVLDTRVIGQGVRRRRECLTCKERFTTYERIARANLMVIKSDGRREEFDQDKLFRGIKLACTKRAISVETVDQLVNQIEAELYKMGKSEIKAETIGKKVMQHLIDLDEVAYVRFASIYLRFADLDALSAEIVKLQAQKARQQQEKAENGSIESLDH